MADYHFSTNMVRQGFKKLFKKKSVDIPDKSPVIIVTNPARDGLIKCLGERLRTAGEYKNRALRVIYTGENQGIAYIILAQLNHWPGSTRAHHLDVYQKS